MEKYLVIGVITVILGFAFIGSIIRNKMMCGVAKGGVCSLLIVVINYIIPQFAIGFNLCTIGVAMILGLPGVMSMYLLQLVV